MKFISDKIEEVVNAMRPIDISYGQPMLDFMAARASHTDLSLAPFFMYGHRVEIANRLMDKDKGDYRYTKYPLICLFSDTDDEPNGGGMYEHRLKMAIIMLTDEDWNAEERRDLVGKPVLAPLFDHLMKELGNSGFTWDGDGRYVPGKPTFMPYWGTQFGDYAGNDKNILSDPIDAIVVNLKLYSEEIC